MASDLEQAYYHLAAIDTLAELINAPNCPIDIRKAAEAELLCQIETISKMHPPEIQNHRSPSEFDAMSRDPKEEEEIPF